MTKKEYNEIKDRLECPGCHSYNVDLWFTNIDGEEVDYTYVNDNEMVSENSFNCTCNRCGFDDGSHLFDYKAHDQWKKMWHTHINRKKLKELTLN